MGFTGFSAVLLFLVVTGCIGTPGNVGWAPVDVNSEMVVDAVILAAAEIGVTPTFPALFAFRRDRTPTYTMYRVTFTASRPFGVTQTCWAEVHWNHRNPMVLHSGKCWF